MKLFHPIKDNGKSNGVETPDASSCCGNIDAESVAKSEKAKEALAELGMDTTIDHVTDFVQIASYGVMSTPALVVDGKVVSYGKVLSKDEVKSLLQKVRGDRKSVV